MTNNEAIELLVAAGFKDGWAVSNGLLILWEHDKNPPAPFVRPDETPSPA